MSEPAKLVLPEAPDELDGPVKAWEQPVTIETYEPERANPNPVFLENRVYQGSSGKVYPLPLIERIAKERQPRLWKAAHIENEFLRVMILPELGGRIHVGLDKTNGYDFFYRQNVIKPALVGLAGPWVSGGVEFNWPQHHRPATYMPVQTHIEQHDDGSVTIWSSDHDPFHRMKGAHGVCLHPGKAILELKVRLYNRTSLTQTFLWWANAATRVDELYQSFFPPDVHFVADHARRAMSTYPFSSGIYYGIDYAKRAREGVPEEETPSQFVPPGTYAPNDLRWYANIPVPTSYMALGSEEDFSGGYDHHRKAGVIHIANHHIAPGKKQWTWGNQEFGYSWDRQLTDTDGPYIELMAGVYTDNQPDFSFLGPGETRTFSQFWYPIQGIGVAHAANTSGACHVDVIDPRTLEVALYTTEEYSSLRVAAIVEGRKSDFTWTGDCGPGHAVRFRLQTSSDAPADHAAVIVWDRDGNELLRYFPPQETSAASPPAAASEPPLPSEVESVEELFLIAQHLEQYRHATRDPVCYWQEGLRRDPNESRCLEALALWHLRRGEFGKAESFLQRVVARLTMLNSNPANGSAFYHLGVVQRFLGKDKEAYDSLFKATWNFAQRSAARLLLAQIDGSRERFEDALNHLDEALRSNTDDLRARNLKVVLLRKLGREAEAAIALAENSTLDPTDEWVQYLADGKLPNDNRMLLDLAFDCSAAGLINEAMHICRRADFEADDGSIPIVCYTLAFLSDLQGNEEFVAEWLAKARAACPDFSFPSRLEELLILEWALGQGPTDGRAHYYLGNLLYDKRRYEEAITAWEASVRDENALPTAWRNLGIAYFNVRNDVRGARDAYDHAFALNAGDARVFFERDQLWKRTSVPQADRFREFEGHRDLVDRRDDLSIEWIGMLNQAGRHEEALASLSSRTFQPWEGGEGLVMEQHVRTHVALGRRAMLNGDYERALRHFEGALTSPPNLGEATHPLANRSNVYFWIGEACQRLRKLPQAQDWWQKAISSEKDFQEMSVQPFSAMSFYRVLSFQRQGREDDANALLAALRDYATQLDSVVPKVDYFATSLPNTLLFRDNLAHRQHILSRLIQAQVLLAAGAVEKGNSMLEEILREEPGHTLVSDLCQESDCLERLGLYDAYLNPETRHQ